MPFHRSRPAGPTAGRVPATGARGSARLQLSTHAATAGLVAVRA